MEALEPCEFVAVNTEQSRSGARV